MTTRRELIQQSIAAAFLAQSGAAAPFADSDPGWFDRPMRWAQLNLTEDDPAKMDIGFWLDYFKRIHADATCLTAGGVVAFYPTKIQFHHRSQWLDKNPIFLLRPRRRLPEAGHDRRGANGSSCHVSGGLRCSPGLDRCGRSWQQAPPSS